LSSQVRNLYKYVKLYSGADPVFDEEDVFKLTTPWDDYYSLEQGKSSEKKADKSRDIIIRLLQENPFLSANALAEKNRNKSTRS
jgi:predicted HTH transcriptional regulator